MTMKNETKHTPGPWTIGHGEEQFNASNIYAESGGICSVYGIPLHSKFLEVENVERFGVALANAKLIASAPDLAAENQKLRDLLESIAPKIGAMLGRLKFSTTQDAEILPEIWAAIRKAKGKQ